MITQALLAPVAFAQSKTPSSEVPLTLEAALLQAQTGPDALIAEARFAAAEESLAAARTLVSGELTAAVIETWAPAGWTTTVSYGATLGFNAVPLGPQHEAAIRANSALERARAQQTETRDRTIIAVTRAFLSAQRAEEELTLARRELELSRHRLDATSALLQAGAATPEQARSAELGTARAENTLFSAERGVEAALDELSYLLGVNVNELSPSDYSPLPKEAHRGSVARLEQRADVTDDRLAVIEAELSLSAAARAARPRVSVTLDARRATDNGNLAASIGFDTRNYQPTIKLNASTTTAVTTAAQSSVALNLAVAVPLGTAPSLELSTAQHSLDAAAVRLEQTRFAAINDVESKRRAVALTEQRLALEQLTVEQSQAAAEQTRTRHELGLVTTTEIESAELQLSRAQLARVRAADALLIAKLELAKATAAPLVEEP